MEGSYRVDKFLWAVRIFKTRSLATDICKSKRIIINDIAVKPSRIIKIGDIIEYKQAPIIRTFEVLDFPKSRVSAKLSINFVKETTPESSFEMLKQIKNTIIKRDKGSGRPTKKERRLLDNLNKPND
jgi:ribosome-associated heat shock protein Hsp15